VIAIIAILAAILFPVFAQAKAAAKKTACISNIKQMTLAALSYMSEHDDKVMSRYEACPSTGAINGEKLWTGSVYPYVKNKQVYLDPAAPVTAYSELWTTRGEPSIGYNSTVSGWYYPNASGCGDMILPMQSQMVNPAKNVIFAISMSGLTAQGYRGYLSRNDALNVVSASAPVVSISDRHQAGTPHAFFDGHAKWYKAVAVLANPNAPYQCEDTSLYTGLWYLDANAAHIKWNVTDPCIGDP